MTDVLLFLLAASVAHGLARWTRLPAIPLLILTGIALRLTGWLPDEDFLSQALLLGVTVLVFHAGTELGGERVGSQAKTALWVGLVQFTVLAAVGTGAGHALGFDPLPSAYLGLALAGSSTLVVVRLIRQRAQAFEPFGRLVIGVLRLQDVLIIACAAVLTRVTDGLGAMAFGIVATVLLLGLTALLSREGMPRVLGWLDLDEESLLLWTLAVLFLFAGLAWILQLPPVFGAFLAGLTLARFPVSGQVRANLEPLGSYFLAFFMVALGATLRPPGPWEVWVAGIFALLVLVVTPILVSLIGERAGLTARSSLEAGLLLAQTSELSLVVALIGHQSGHIGDSAVQIVALVTVVTMMLTPLLATDGVTWRLLRLHPSRWARPPATPPSGHLLLLGCGPSTFPLVTRLVATGLPVLVVDRDPIVLDRVQELGAQALHGDSADPSILLQAGAQRAQVAISTMGRVRDNWALLQLRREGPVLVRVFELEDAEWVREHGALPVLTSEAAARACLRWMQGA